MRAVLYTWSSCPFCIRAKELLERRGIPYTEHVMDDEPVELARLKREHGHPTVPIILLDGKLVGGCDDLERLDRAGRLSGRPT